jgi:hypothetical protein
MPVDIEGAAEQAKSVLPGGGDLIDLMGDPELGDLQGERRIAKRPNKPFFLRHMATDWTIAIIDGAPVLLPELAPHVLLPGVNGVRTRDREEELSATYRDAVQDAIRQGWTYLPWSLQITDPAHLPAGVGPGKYIRDLKCRDRLTKAEGVFYTEAWNVPVPTPVGQDQQFKFDHAAFNRWRASIVRSAPGAQDGLIDPPMDSVVELLRQRTAHHLGNVRARPNHDPRDRDAKVTAAEKRVELAESAVAPKKVAASKATGRKA